MRRLLALLFALSVAAWAVDGAVPFAPSVEGSFAAEGFAGFYASPARIASPGFGLGFFRVLDKVTDVDEFSAAAYGEMGSERWRLSFFEALHGLDSLYRQSYSELDIALVFGWLAFGGAYGLSMEWIPGDCKWARHRYKAGALALWRDFSFGVAVYGFTDEFVELGGGVHWKPDGHFSVFVEGDVNGFRVGNAVRFEHGEIAVLYGFPSFSVSVAVNFYWRGWFAGASIGSGDLPVWGVFSGKRLKKKKLVP